MSTNFLSQKVIIFIILHRFRNSERPTFLVIAFRPREPLKWWTLMQPGFLVASLTRAKDLAITKMMSGKVFLIGTGF
jgi:hypothetical protein